MPAVRYKDFGQLSLADIMVYQAIPPHPLWDKVSQVIDFSFADEICAALYSSVGQRPYAPSLKLKIHLVQQYYGISDREMELKVIGDIFVKRFLGLPVEHSKFDHSTIALDRDRLGAEMFHACHVFILVQALERGLFGKEDDRWLVDSFHTNARVSTPGTFELIQQAADLVLRHLEKRNPTGYANLLPHIQRDKFSQKLKHGTTKAERNVALSELVVQSYGLIAWIERLCVDKELVWDAPKEQQKSEDYRERLLRVLRENVTRDPDDKKSKTPSSFAETTDSQATLEYTERPKGTKPGDRLVNAFDPEIRVGYKTSTRSFVGDKVQVVESATSKLILLAEPIAGNEPDGKALLAMVLRTVNEFGVKPSEVVADKGYAWGANFRGMKEKQLKLTAPLPKTVNPTGKYPNSQFTHDPEARTVICPHGQTTSWSTHIEALAGTQYKFKRETCTACPLKGECWKPGEKDSRVGRTVFISDYAEEYKEVATYLHTPEGKEALQARAEIERTNHEMKRHHGLREPRTRGRNKLRISVMLTSMVINIKVMVKSLLPPQPKPTKAPVCA